ncbi:hypothetical protein GA0116948_11759 [Chitinophaga costaii]|uniref:CCDC81-like prokaryotic HU domain-containing protein n=1 Tax=Chitinophaga costaii TaxID=1335309 RepID=A0A1C4FWD4_9BACT|nr:hypothetical protein [Chitinophaga costaii]PUZ27244.1 hypothetical protein DCM91_08515 [Chitinophaga costaii]SCC59831.1 hypothetical protein GA0116948_11759 [Chitinophaga costaii]
MIIQQYLQEVLFGQQVCVVPRIGTFTLQRIPARYNATDRTLSPPQQVIAFSPLWDDDGICLHWIAQKENLLDYAAEIRLNKGLDEILGPLAAGEKVHLQGIGSLLQDEHGSISFQPDVLPGHMDTLTMPPHNRYVPVEPEIRLPEPEQGEAELEEAEANEFLSASDNTGGDVWDTSPERRKNLWWIAIPLVIIAGLTAAGIWWYSSQPPVITPPPAKPALDSSLTQPAAMQDTTVKPTPDTLMAEMPDVTYRIVFQTYALKDSARAYAKFRQLKVAFNNVIIYPTPDTTFYRIALPSVAVDTASNMEVMRQYQRGKVFIEH